MFFGIRNRRDEENEENNRFREDYSLSAVHKLVDEALTYFDPKRKYFYKRETGPINIEKVISDNEQLMMRDEEAKKQNIKGKVKVEQIWEDAKESGIRGYIIGYKEYDEMEKRSKFSRPQEPTRIERFVIKDNKIYLISHIEKVQKDDMVFSQTSKKVNYVIDEYQNDTHMYEVLRNDIRKLAINKYFIVSIDKDGNVKNANELELFDKYGTEERSPGLIERLV